MRRFLVGVLAAALAAACGPGAATGGGEGGGGTAALPSGAAPSTPDGTVSHDVPAGEAPGPMKATSVTPRPGPAGDPIAPVKVRARSSGGRAFADVYWWGGIEPCSVLRPVGVVRHGHAIRLTLTAGSDAGDGTACIELARYTTTRVSLGSLAGGTYRITAGAVRATLRV
jgi:hypothetical protein